MKGLILKDLYCLKGYVRQYLLLMAFFMIFGISTGNSHYAMWMSLVIGLNFGFAAFPTDEAGGYAYMLSCPVGRRTYVQARYLIHMVGALLMFACSLIGEILGRLINGQVSEIWLTEMAVVLGLYFFYTSILIPVSYRYGVEKARIVLLGMIALPVVVVFLSVRLIEIPALEELTRAAGRMFTGEQMLCYGAFAVFIFCLLLMGISYLLSVKIFEKKEF